MQHLLLGAEQAEYLRIAQEYSALGVPEDLAADVSSVLFRFQLLDVVTVASRLEESTQTVAQLYFSVTERFGVDRLLTRITKLPRVGRWQTLARLAVRSDLYAAVAGVTLHIARETPGSEPAAMRLLAWEQLRSAELARVTQVLSEIDGLESHDLATLSVALRAIRTLLSQGSAARARE